LATAKAANNRPTVSLVQQAVRLWPGLRFFPHNDGAAGTVSVIIHIVKEE
jgi:hypothetical protein